MNALYFFAAPIVSFVFLALVFSPLERCFPAKIQNFFRPGWLTDLCYFLGQYLLWGGVVFGALAWCAPTLSQLIPSTFRTAVASQPMWLQMIEVILLSDLLIYWGHRIQHRVPLLWRYHAVHHSSEHLDWLAAHREHPLDTVYTVGLINLPAFLLGFDLSSLAAFTAFRGIWAIYIHSNVKLNLGPLRAVIGAPELHHWHHARDRFAGNYANLSPLMDLIFGTYRHPGHEPSEYGIKEPFPKSYPAQIIHPLLPKRFRKKISATSSVIPPSN